MNPEAQRKGGRPCEGCGQPRSEGSGSTGEGWESVGAGGGLTLAKWGTVQVLGAHEGPGVVDSPGPEG